MTQNGERKRKRKRKRKWKEKRNISCERL